MRGSGFLPRGILPTGEPIQFGLQGLHLFPDRNRPFELEHRKLGQWMICHLIRMFDALMNFRSPRFVVGTL
jgi:hypothetical protein